MNDGDEKDRIEYDDVRLFLFSRKQMGKVNTINASMLGDVLGEFEFVNI